MVDEGALLPGVVAVDLGLLDGLVAIVPGGLNGGADAVGVNLFEPGEVDGVGQGQSGADIAFAAGF